MKKEEKQLLLKDICARLPYGVFLNIEQYDGTNIYRMLKDITDAYNPDIAEIYVDGDDMVGESFYVGETIKPYLRSMSSMTEEEENKYNSLNAYEGGIFPHTEEAFDWLNAHHFDYRGLIEKGLAIEVTEENNPYKN